MPNLGRREYYWRDVTVSVGASDQAVALLTTLLAGGRDKIAGSPTWLKITTDVAVSVKINATTADLITVTAGATAGIEIPAGVMAIDNLYFSHTGASSASGDATVTIRAA